jgi:hypothetical protein
MASVLTPLCLILQQFPDFRTENTIIHVCLHTYIAGSHEKMMAIVTEIKATH